MAFAASATAQRALPALDPSPGPGRRYRRTLDNRRLARRIQAFHRLMRYRRTLAVIQGPADAGPAAEALDSEVLMNRRHEQLLLAIERQARAVAREQLNAHENRKTDIQNQSLLIGVGAARLGAHSLGEFVQKVKPS